MLVLSRKRNESIVIVDVRGDKVRLGIEAPADVIVHRSEVAERIETEQRISPAAGQTT